VFAVLNAAAWWLDLMWLPPLLLWWLKPAFERAPLYVLSRGVFGAAPGVRETLRGQFHFARSIWPWLLWLRFSPSRALLMPVDLLEGVSGPLRRARRQALARNASGTAALVLLVCANVEAVLAFGLIGLALTLTPIEFMEPAAQALWETLFEAPPLWAQLLLNLIFWIGASLIAPFYVGAGFALYLNRRTQIEAWDIELGFRRLVARINGSGQALLALLAPLLLLLSLSLAAPAKAQDEAAADAPKVEETFDDSEPSLRTRHEEPSRYDHVGPGGSSEAKPEEGDRLRQVFAHEYREGTDDFVVQAAEVYEQDALSPVGTQSIWVPREKPQTRREQSRMDLGWLHSLGRGLAFLMENILWLLAAALLVLLIATHRRWLPVVGVEIERRRGPRLRHEDAAQGPEPLPEDLLAAAQALWAQGHRRAALALLYAGGVERVVDATGEPLPPGSTEADCLRRARKLGVQGFGGVFPRIVQRWQSAAYADRLPSEAEFDELVDLWRRHETAVGGGASA
jgi:hypothetical protein